MPLRAGRAGRPGSHVLGAGARGNFRALVDAVAAGCTDRVLRGACEPLFTARPLGPFVDIAASLPDALAAAITGGNRVHAALPELLDELTARPSMVIIEDAHWADKASLDLIALLGRRMAKTASLLVVTFRDDELAIDHPLRHVLGALVGHGPESVQQHAAPMPRAGRHAQRALQRYIDQTQKRGKLLSLG